MAACTSLRGKMAEEGASLRERIAQLSIVVALGLVLPVCRGIHSPSCIYELEYDEDRERFYYFGYAQVEGLKKCTTLS